MASVALSLFLAQIIGLFLVIVSLSSIVNRKVIIGAVEAISKNPAVLYVSGILALAFGLVVVIAHPIYVADWRIAITIIGWLAIFKGIARLFFTRQAAVLIGKICKRSELLYALQIVALIIGIYLAYVGFFAL